MPSTPYINLPINVLVDLPGETLGPVVIRHLESSTPEAIGDWFSTLPPAHIESFFRMSEDVHTRPAEALVKDEKPAIIPPRKRRAPDPGPKSHSLDKTNKRLEKMMEDFPRPWKDPPAEKKPEAIVPRRSKDPLAGKKPELVTVGRDEAFAWLRRHSNATPKEFAEGLKLTPGQAKGLLRRMVNAKQAVAYGKGRKVTYSTVTYPDSTVNGAATGAEA